MLYIKTTLPNGRIILTGENVPQVDSHISKNFQVEYDAIANSLEHEIVDEVENEP